MKKIEKNKISFIDEFSQIDKETLNKIEKKRCNSSYTPYSNNFIIDTNETNK